MKSNITILCQVDSFGNTVAKQIADKLDLYFADINDFLAFNLTASPEEIMRTCGKEYLNKLEMESVQTVASFENAIINCPIRLFMNTQNRHALKDNSLVVYLKSSIKTFDKYVQTIKDNSKRLELENRKEVFEDYDKMCSRSSEMVIEIKDFNEKAVLKKTLKVINNYFK